MANQAAVTAGRHRLREILDAAGLFYTMLFATRWIVNKFAAFLDRRLVAIEQRKQLLEPWTASARRFTVDDNKRLWNSYDWSKLGEEWTSDEQWKSRFVNEYLVPNIPEGGVVLELGPGGGRWTEILQKRCGKLHVVDVSERALELCRERFADCRNIEYHLGNGSTLNVPSGSVDAVWSYDVMVHIRPLDARAYFQEFRRILKPGGRAVIHHPGDRSSSAGDRPGWRSDLTNAMVLTFVRENGLRLLQQTTKHINPNDVMTTLEAPNDAGVPLR
jgi:ubiquinone/menaquinone biosynthesis C-methylase UbiE